MEVDIAEFRVHMNAWESNINITNGIKEKSIRWYPFCNTSQIVDAWRISQGEWIFVFELLFESTPF